MWRRLKYSSNSSLDNYLPYFVLFTVFLIMSFTWHSVHHLFLWILIGSRHGKLGAYFWPLLTQIYPYIQFSLWLINLNRKSCLFSHLTLNKLMGIRIYGSICSCKRTRGSEISAKFSKQDRESVQWIQDRSGQLYPGYKTEVDSYTLGIRQKWIVIPWV